MSRPIVLPELPPAYGLLGAEGLYGWHKGDMHAYARAAVEADRKGQSQACPDDCAPKASIVVTFDDVQRALEHADDVETILETFAKRLRGET